VTPFTVLHGRAVLLDQANVDTDQIIPARFLRKPRSAGYGNFLFHDLPAVRNAVQGAAILLAGPNFGCGSSREGAVYALLDAGIRCVIAPGFGDIFAGNAGKNGLLTITLPDAARFAGEAMIDLDTQRVTAGPVSAGFEIDPFRKRCLLEGLDDIGLTLEHGPAIAAWEGADATARPWVVPAG
jgi:3-isopropylmalate/(R)-2-methylmalate dehydratase small subunit